MSDQQAQAVVTDDLPSIGRRAGRGLRWTLTGNLVLKVGSFALSLAMVRLLAPHDFGLYAVALAANAFLIHVNDVGLIAATVQWRGDVDEMAATARTMAITFSVGWYALFWVGAPILADAAGSPDAAPLIRLLTLVIVLDGVTAVSVGVIQRRFQQDKLMKAIAVGFVCCAVVNLTLAVAGAGAYSFVIGSLVQAVVVAILVLRAARMPFRLGLDRAVARRLLVFGIPLAAGLGVESVVLYSDSVIVGHVLGTVALGFYLLAFNISSWVPGMVGAAVRYVSIPAFSRLAEGESETFTLGVQRALPMLLTFVAPVAAVMVTLSPALIHVLYGEHWVPAAEALRFLAFVMVARMFTALVFDIQTGLGNTKVTVGLNLVWLVALLPALWIGAHHGIRGAAIGHALVALTVAIPLAGWLLHRAGVHMGPVVRRLVRPVVAAVAAGATMAAVAHEVGSPFAQLVLGGGLGMVVYALVALPRDQRAPARRWVSSFLAARRGAQA
ncbi:MAG TPA: oligosaccharide flippase family protein [Nocardioides sp.]|uniref:oligosaccharide flippase family protein n=1 Tax=Nocardioides sp. TaxID=35761 RepID=UPI002E36EF3E|nr:oligosaccharide flippase family protein [Nocardioides sp.]HEX5089025.1 oligosaccharide flippase family protein [Nocardioides sp.]